MFQLAEEEPSFEKKILQLHIVISLKSSCSMLFRKSLLSLVAGSSKTPHVAHGPTWLGQVTQPPDAPPGGERADQAAASSAHRRQAQRFSPVDGYSLAICLEVSMAKWGYSHSWMVYFMEHPIEMDAD